MTYSLMLMAAKIHVGTSVEECRAINTKLLEDEGSDRAYEKEVFENLILRYEEPNGMTRWDSPLFTVLFDDETPPLDAIWNSMFHADGSTKSVKPNQSTVLVGRRPLFMSPDSTKTWTGTPQRIRLFVRTGEVHTGSSQQNLCMAKRSSR